MLTALYYGTRHANIMITSH